MPFLGPVGNEIKLVKNFHLSANGKRIIADFLTESSGRPILSKVIRVFEQEEETISQHNKDDASAITSPSWIQIGQNLTSAGEGASFAISADGNRVAIVEEIGGNAYYFYNCTNSCPRAIIRVYDYDGEKKEWVQAGGAIELLHFSVVDIKQTLIFYNDACVCLGIESLSISADGNRLAIQLSQNDFHCQRIDVYEFQVGSSSIDDVGWTPLGSSVMNNCTYGSPFPVRMSGNGNRLILWNKSNDVFEVYDYDGGNFRLQHSWKPYGSDRDYQMDLNHDGDMIVFRSSSFIASVWNVVDGVEVASVETSSSSVTSVSMDSVGKMVAVGTSDEKLYLWDGNKWSSFQSNCIEYPLRDWVVLSKDGNRIATRYDGWRNYYGGMSLFDIIRRGDNMETTDCAVREWGKKSNSFVIPIVIVTVVNVLLFIFVKASKQRAAAAAAMGQQGQNQQGQEQEQATVNMEANCCLDGSNDNGKKERLLVKLQSKQKVFVVKRMDCWGGDKEEGKLAVYSQQPGANGESDGGWLDVDDSCTICLGPYEVDQEVCYAINRACTHYFHLECMLKWLLDHEKCPMCYATYLEEADETMHDDV